MTVDRFAVAARITELQSHVRAIESHLERTSETIERLVRDNRTMRARLDQLEERERWIDAYRADHD